MHISSQLTSFKNVSDASSLIDKALHSRSEVFSFSHLRRVARVSALPIKVRAVIDPTLSPESPYPFAVLGGPASTLTESELDSTLGGAPEDCEGLAHGSAIPHTLHRIRVPRNAPADQASAETWSAAHWPTIFRAHNPFGPRPAQWNLAERSLGDNVGQWMAAARQLGLKAARSGRGEMVGAVIVDTEMQRVVAGAGDARWHAEGDGGDGVRNRARESNPLAHAAMRAIALVGRQRVALAAGAAQDTAGGAVQGTTADKTEGDTKPKGTTAARQPDHPDSISAPSFSVSPALHDTPLSVSEASLTSKSPLKPGGYLCTQLSIFLTHEPCVMCAMAILHSRFDAVVFERAMATGGLMAQRAGHEQPAEQTPAQALAAEHSMPPPHSNKSADSDTHKPASPERHDATLARDSPTCSVYSDDTTGTRQSQPQCRPVAYGLWHRPELNWRPMAWQWEDYGLEGGEQAVEHDDYGSECGEYERSMHA